MSAASKRAIRRIVVEGQPFFWRFGQDKDGQYIFSAYSREHRTSPLVICFGWNCESGFVRGHPTINLYTPMWAAALIRYGLTQGWRPENRSHPFIMRDGVSILATLALTASGDSHAG